MKYYIVAGEASGDLHGASLMHSIKKHDKNADFRFFGGNLMQKEGGTLVKHFKSMAFMGVFIVIANIRTIKKNMNFCKNDILNFQPDMLILIDFPGFNLRIAEFAHNNNLKVYYYISPKIWAWNKKRAKKIKLYIDKLFVIFPFEIDFYKNLDYKVEYFGNPTVDVVENELKNKITFNEFIKKHELNNKPIIALLPGSRKQEIKKLLPVMLPLIDKYKDYQFVIGGVSSLDKELYQSVYKDMDIKIIFDQTYKLLQHSTAAIVTSGTATLETALFDVPQVVCYKAGAVSYFIAINFVVNIEFFSLVNIIMKKEIIKELLQKKLPERIDNELNKILNNNEYRSKMLENYQKLKNTLGKSGSPERTAKFIVFSL